METPLESKAFGQLFSTARTYNEWSARKVPDTLIREIYELFKWGPTSANSNPARYVWVCSVEAKAKLAGVAAEGNRSKVLAAPVTVIVGYDLAFPETLPALFPARGEMMKNYFNQPAVTESTAFRNSSLQGAYLILAARALGLDCGPMSGFDNAGVDKAFFSGTLIKSNFICSLGYGKPGTPHPRNPRPDFEKVNRLL